MGLDNACHHAASALPSLLPISILIASFLGSLHCVGMCGGLILASTSSTLGVMYYHVGRLIAYMLLGLASGYIGNYVMNIPLVPIAIGISFIGIGIMALSSKLKRFHFPFATPLLEKIVRLKSKVSAHIYSGIIGFASIFLPCGWLYTYVLAVSQTKNPLLGAALMALFWLGTLPALISSPILVRRFLKPLSQPITAIIFIIVGLLTILIRL